MGSQPCTTDLQSTGRLPLMNLISEQAGANRTKESRCSEPPLVPWRADLSWKSQPKRWQCSPASDHMDTTLDWELVASYAGLLGLAALSIYAGAYGSLPVSFFLEPCLLPLLFTSRSRS